tara:strand:- start:5390 stop:5803 length:414 start_codon:yes stop_codon:yes gene_type:complete
MMIYDMNKNLLEGNCEVVIPYLSEPPRPFNITNFSNTSHANFKDINTIAKVMIGFYMYLICNLFYLVIKDNCYRLKEYSKEEDDIEQYDEDDYDEDYDEDDDDYEEELELEDVVKTSKRQKENAAYQRRKSLRSYNK